MMMALKHAQIPESSKNAIAHANMERIIDEIVGEVREEVLYDR
jgi:hypothetical protein